MAADREPVLLIQFAREPQLGQVKTRLAAGIGDDAALDVHCALVEWVAGRALGARLGPVELHVAGDCSAALFEHCRQLGVSAFRSQVQGDLGQRMYRALQAGLARFERVLLIGSDCPGIDADYLAAAALALTRSPLVLGPAVDGGYVLIGATRVDASLFTEMPWGSEVVYATTLQRLHALGWEYAELPPLADIDRPEDLPQWQAVRGAWRPGLIPA